MKSVILLAGFGLSLGVTGVVGHTDAQALPVCGGGWVRVGNACVLPEDLSIGDRVQISIGSAVNGREVIVGFAECEGHRTYYTSSQQSGCGWRNAITAYARTDGGADRQIESTSALDVPR